MKIQTALSVSLLMFMSALISADSVQSENTSEFQSLKKEAETFISEGSYSRAHELYKQATTLKLELDDTRWVDFRLADTSWRAQSATSNADQTLYEQARVQLEVLVRDVTRTEDQDWIWAEVQESLGDFWWLRRDSRNWGMSWSYYQKALDWWAGAKEVELARSRYLSMVWKMAQPPQTDSYYYYTYRGNAIPINVLDNVLKIAQNENDKARAHYLIAMTTRYIGGDWNQRVRVSESFEASLKAGTTTDWYDDALYHYGQWMEQTGRITLIGNNQWRQESDFVKAIELYQRILQEFTKGQTRYYDDARSRIEQITKPVVRVHVSNVFLPDSEIQYYLNWRNVKQIELALYSIDLTRDVKLYGAENDDWINHLDVIRGVPDISWSYDTEDKGEHAPGQHALKLDKKLPTGAYLLEARAGGEKSRELILVTDAGIILKTSHHQVLVYFSNSFDGSPLPDADISLWQRYYDGNNWVWRSQTGKTNPDGVAVFEVAESNNSETIFVAAKLDERQALSMGRSYGSGNDEPSWKIYAFTDRPAYRPGELASWKFIARRYENSIYFTPASEIVEYQINDPRGTKVIDGKSTLNAFGSAWGSVELTESMPLGEYRITFWDEGKKKHIGNATLFRLEEYKLPEFKVEVSTPDEGGKKKTFQLGDTVEVDIQADYYFGGAVSNASVEVIIYQSPFHHWWSPQREYGWYYQDMIYDPRRYYGRSQGQEIKRETLKTDVMGKAHLKFNTPRHAAADYEYRIEARVIDSSRREIISSSTVRVTRQRYYAYLNPQHHLYRPQDKVSIDVKTIDANEQPVQVNGTIKVTRDYWYEIWIDPNGREVAGDRLKGFRKSHSVFPPPPKEPNGKAWHLKFQGYEHDEVLTRNVKTDKEGEAVFSFTPEREGYYRVAWSSEDDAKAVIRTETTVWIATTASTEIGYRHGGLEIIVDKDTFQAGQTAPVMLVAPTNDRYVLFSVEGDDLYSYKLVHIEGTVKLVGLPIEEKHVPNIFLNAAMISDHQMFMDTKQVVVPPVKQFLNITVEANQNEYLPREKGTLVVTARDHNDQPVSAEIAIGLVDESIYYIQEDYAQDPREFFYGTKRRHIVRTTSSFQHRAYAKLVEGEADVLVDERIVNNRLLGAAGRSGLKKEAFGRRRSGGGDYLAQDEEMYLMDSLSAPMSVVSESSSDMKMQRRANKSVNEISEYQGPPGEEPAVQVRSDFRSTILWQPEIVTGVDGKATVDISFADSLTSWKATARVNTTGNHFGTSSTTVRTRQPLIVRLQAPRFFVAGDTVTISAVINNNTGEPMKVSPDLKAEGVKKTWIRYKGMDLRHDSNGQSVPLTVPANGEVRVDWGVSVERAGEAKLKVVAIGAEYSDAMEKTYPVYEHGIEKFIAKSGKVRNGEATVTLDIPAQRQIDSTSLIVQISPSLAVTMLDALPYLINYPYGCIEQTMSRFLPTVVVAKTLNDLGVSQEVAMNRLFGGIEQAFTEKTHKKGKQGLDKLDAMVKEGLDRIYDFQGSDGGWGWWKENESDHFMSAYVVWGLALAQQAGVDVKPGVLTRGVQFLDVELVEEESNYDMQAWMLHAISVYEAAQFSPSRSEFQIKAFDSLMKNRDALNAYTRALLALSAHNYGDDEKAQTLVRNLENGVIRDHNPDVSIVQRGTQESHDAVMATAHWGNDGIHYRWSDGGVESTAFVLRALLTIDPKNQLIEPTMNWLIKNRRGAQWSNTRDTAIVVLVMTDYLSASDELAGSLSYELFVNNKLIASKSISADDALSAPSEFVIDQSLIRDGANQIRFVRTKGEGPLYFSAQAKFFSLEEPITPAGSEIFVRRQYYKLIGRPTLLKGYVYDKVPLNDGESVVSGERIETVITIEAKNNYEYLIFEDLKPAGFEAVQIRSGESLYAKQIKSGAFDRRYTNNTDTKQAAGQKLTAAQGAREVWMPTPQPTLGSDYTGKTRWVYQELRDRHVAMFIDKLPQGVWEIRYDLRAEVPGEFHALPVMGHAMYVPEIRANSQEVRITVEDRSNDDVYSF